jgi:hypothetical protein
MEVCCGSFDTKVYLLNGVTGSIHWAYTLGNRVFSVRGTPDLSGNGVPDVIAGTQKLTTGGICYAFEGGAPVVAVDGPGHPNGVSVAHALVASPNPFAGSTRWRVADGITATSSDPCSSRGHSILVVFDGGGRELLRLVPTTHAGAELIVDWNGRDREDRSVPPGVYFARLIQGGRAVAEGRVTRFR